MSDDEDASLGVSDGDLSSTDLSDGERGAKDMGERAESPPEVGDPPPLLTGYGQMYIVRKQDPEIDQGRNRQVTFVEVVSFISLPPAFAQSRRPLSISTNCE